MKDCEETRRWLDAHLDRELDPVNTAYVEAHLQECATCSQVYQEQAALEQSLSGLPRYTMPAGLSERVQSALRAEAGEESVNTIPFLPAPRSDRRWVMAMAASLLVCASLAGALLFSKRVHISADDLLAREVVASHVRSMMASHLADVTSTDQHTVKPWFDGKLDFAPPVVDFAASGFPLVGGRLDYLSERPVAAVVYRRDNHVINLFVRPAPEMLPNGAVKTTTHQGYNVVFWMQAGTSFCAVSDLNETELRQFVELVRRSTPS